MKVPLSWLKKYVPISISTDDLAHRLTMAGTEVGQVQKIGADWDRDKVIVGRGAKVDSHPNADRLTLPTVDLGNGETMAVVCGAPNVAAGQKIAFAREGARLFSPRSGELEPLKAARIRGVQSSGMVCSALELGLGEDHEGILVLDDEAPIGTPLADYLGDAVLDIEVTPNRPDCLSILGVAHEVGALTGQPVREPDISYPEDGPAISSQVSISVADPDLCRRYTASLITGVKIGPSPRWLQERLTKAGYRPISNVVDVTNYVMLEYDQPLHSFDYDRLKDHTVIVRRAQAGETLVTLDGVERKLTPDVLVIADAHDPIGIGGVIGGANSEIGPDTGSIHLLGKSVETLPMTARAGLGMARSFQVSALAPSMSGLEHVVLALLPHEGGVFHFLRPVARERELRDRAGEMLARVGMLDRAEIPVAGLSHGERRQLEIAIALALEPRVLLLDEPMAGMGPEGSARLAALLNELRGDMGILLIEHDMDTVFALADRISVMVGGRIVATGNADEIRSDETVKTAYLGETP